MCLTSLFIHGILTESMISVALVPVIKTKTASMYRKCNYRLIALASIVSKGFEKNIYDRIEHSLTTCNSRFGFKTKHSTDSV